MHYSSSQRSFDPQLNVEEDAAALLASAKRTADVTLSYRAQLDREGKGNQPLVVLAGEMHPVISHTLHHILFTNELLKHESTAALIEQPYDLTYKGYKTLTGVKPTGSELASLKTLHDSRSLSIKTIIAFKNYVEAHHSKMTWLQFLLNNHITVHLTDTSMNGLYLDPENVHALSRSGIHLRNQHMFRLSQEIAKTSKARIHIQQCGNAHIAGCNLAGTGWPGYESLLYIFKRASVPVLAMPAFDRSFEMADMNFGHKWLAHDFNAAMNIPEATAIYNPITNEPLADFSSDIECQEIEAEWINSRMAAIGHAEDCFSVDEIAQIKEAYKGEMSYYFKKIRQQFRIMVPV